MMPLVSVILPNFNHSPYLDKRIESILNQTFQDFELIILDDCSSDNSRDVIEKYRLHEKVSHILYNDINSGSTFKQWDKGIQIAKGDYIWIAESDDYCEQTFISELIQPLIADSNLVIAFCQSLFVTPEGKIINKTEAPFIAKNVDGKDFLRKYGLGSNPIANVSMAVFRKDSIKSVPAAYKNFKYCGDWLLYANMSMKGDVFISGKYLNYYLRHDKTVTADSTRLGFDFFEGNKIFHFIKSNINIDQEDMLHALNKRIDRYMDLKNQFSPIIRNEVIKSLLELDPSMKRLLKKRKYLQLGQRFISAVKDKAFSFLM